MNNPGIIKWAFQRKLLPYVPFELGGLGLPPKKDRENKLSRCDKLVQKGIALLALRSPKEYHNRGGLWFANEFKPERRAVSKMVTYIVDHALKAKCLITVRAGRQPPPGYLS